LLLRCGAILSEEGNGNAREIGAAAGAIWHALNSKGELTLAQLKRAAKVRAQLFDWVIGWLAREDKFVITPEKRSFRVRLKDTHTKTAGSAGGDLFS